MHKILFVIILLSVTIFSCQKEISVENGNIDPVGGGTSGTNAKLAGVWKFSFVHAETLADNEVNDQGDVLRTVTRSVYDTKENTGTFSFAANYKASTNNYGYSVDTIGMVYMYENHVFLDSMEMPIQMPYFTVNSMSDYKLVGTDSIYFTSGLLSTGGTTQDTRPGGLKYKIEGSKLTMNFTSSMDTTMVVGGLIAKVKQSATGTITFVK